jgi:PAS domain-containing protein
VLLTAAGERRTWRFRNVLRDGGEGGVPFVIGFAQDVTEEEAFQAALRDSEKRFRQFAENIDAVISIRSVEPPATLFVNAAFERIWGRLVRDDEESRRSPRRPRGFSRPRRGSAGLRPEFRILFPTAPAMDPFAHAPIGGEKGQRSWPASRRTSRRGSVE